MQPVNNPRNLLIATDLDGTLLDHHDYSFEAAFPALNAIRLRGIPLILNSSKTWSEVEQIRTELGITDPFIVENGAGVIIPSDAKNLTEGETLQPKNNMLLKSFGIDLQKILRVLAELKHRHGYIFRGFSEMPVEEVRERTGLSNQQAILAKNRQFSEPVVWLDSDHNWQQFSQYVEQTGLQILRGGRFFHISGGGDKGSALLWLKQCYTRLWQHSPRLIAAGDSHNDVAMLNVADTAVVVRSPVNPVLTLENHTHVITTASTGPAGWNQAMLDIINNHHT
ncbi:MAG: HAD-IIB family hydrolase [Gammaproteobacteria bacterium]|nr:HAD-IIB family hydrolase [Gammaproteobacteria bacterium]